MQDCLPLLGTVYVSLEKRELNRETPPVTPLRFVLARGLEGGLDEDGLWRVTDKSGSTNDELVLPYLSPKLGILI